MTTNWKQTWFSKSDVEIEELLNKQLKAMSKGPRPLSLVKFADDSKFRKTYLTNKDGTSNDVERLNYNSMLYLGNVPNQLGHGAFINLNTNKTYVIDIEELVELTEDET